MMGWYYGNGNGWHMSGWGWAAMTISSVLFLVLLGAIVLLLVRLGSSGSADRPAASRSPEQLLGERFARGEIDEEEYRRRLDVLTGRRTPTG